MKYPHKMYKGKLTKIAKNQQEHNKLLKMGYNHTKPNNKKSKTNLKY